MIILLNPRAYIEIIKKQYMYVPDTNDATQYYVYYGKGSLEKNSISYMRYNFKNFIEDKHDDYDYQI